MTREELIEIISNDTSCFSCPDYSCGMPEEEGNTGECCRRCAERQIAEYEGNILARDIPKKPKEVNITGYGIHWVCCCGKIHRDPYLPKFCSECGQRIDWSD